jgi:PAS domain S-box-containing protein
LAPPGRKKGCDIKLSPIAPDVTAQVTLERAAAQLAAIVNSSEDAIITESLDGVIESWSTGAERLYGFTAAEVVGHPMFSLLPKSLQEEEREILERMRTGETISRFETVRVHKAGRAIPVSLTLAPLRSADGAIVGVSHVARDISEPLLLKDKLQLSQKMEAVGRLAGGVAHDFNNLLTIINGYAALLQAGLSTRPDQLEMLNEITHAAQRATDLTRQLLAFSRRQSVKLRPLDLNEAISKMEAMLRRLIGEDIAIETHLEDNLVPVQADPGQISQILMNLTANARDAMPSGGKIVISTANWSVERDRFHTQLGFTPGRYVRLSFTDTGEGMDAETCAHIFEPFFTTKEVGKGTGLGLSTVYGIVKQAGGQVSVYSEPGCGTTLAIYLPCSPMHAAASETPAPTLQQGSETVLLVEDEPALRKLAHSILQSSGYAVLAASTPEQAIDYARSYPDRIHLLLTDIVMPGMNGQVLSSEVNWHRPDIRNIFMSGYTEHATLQKILSEPGAAFLQKPFTPAQLLDKVREVLDT